MSEKTWLGGIYLKEEGGYEIVLRALNHYKKRLQTINSSPELSGAPMFVQVVQQEAMKSIPKIQTIVAVVNQSLSDSNSLSRLQTEISFIEKSLISYKTDLHKALTESHQYYTGLIPNANSHKNDLNLIDIALKKINQFS